MVQVRFCFASLVAVLSAAAHCEAALLTSTYETQLEAWLSLGDLNFTNIYTKQSGHNAANFHAAVDGKGRTITLMQVASVGNINPTSQPGVGNVVGGYNPQAWNALGNYNVTSSVSEKTAFLFNLATGVKLNQYSNSNGNNQTYNHINYGPAFGGTAVEQFDLVVNSNLTNGSMKQFSYGAPPYGSFSGGFDLLGYSTAAGDPETLVTFSGLEVYSFAPASVSAVASLPEPGSLVVMGIGVLGMVAGGRRRRRLALQAA